jgi:hypothetical protein
MQLHEHPYFPYPSDRATRFAFLIADLVSATIIIGIAFISLKTTLHF